MPIPPINGYVSNSNFYSFNKSNENLTMVGGSAKVGNSSTVSFGAGVDVKTSSKGSSAEPVFEAKYNQNIGKNFNAQARFREIGKAQQYRVTFGGKYNINKHNVVYGAAHYTAKDDCGEWNQKTGGWVGYTHTFKGGVALSGEFQQNVNIGKPTYIKSFDGDKSVNVTLSVPLGKNRN